MVRAIRQAMGAVPEGARYERIQSSPQFHNGRFRNELKAVNATGSAVMRWLKGAPHREPKVDIPVAELHTDDYKASGPALRVTWFGHSSVLVELDGKRILTDPVWGRASPSRLLGPKRFYEAPLTLAQLPPLDAVVLSHDHYDHLDYYAIRELIRLAPCFVVPLGVGAHLEMWGARPKQIVELDWWESTDLGEVELVCTPARHFSGRTIKDGNQTLWSSWCLLGKDHRVFFSGDGGYFPGFATIGERYGPFQLTLMESGAYDQTWPDVHMGPEQAIQAHRDLKGQQLMPIHWGTYNLALHPWTEPVERLVYGMSTGLAIPRPGQIWLPDEGWELKRWWPELPWRSSDVVPIVSSSLADGTALPSY